MLDCCGFTIEKNIQAIVQFAGASPCIPTKDVSLVAASLTRSPHTAHPPVSPAPSFHQTLPLCVGSAKLGAAGIKPEDLNFKSVTMDSGAFICIRETAAQSVAIIDTANPTNTQRMPAPVELSCVVARSLLLCRCCRRTKLECPVLRRRVRSSRLTGCRLGKRGVEMLQHRTGGRSDRGVAHQHELQEVGQAGVPELLPVVHRYQGLAVLRAHARKEPREIAVVEKKRARDHCAAPTASAPAFGNRLAGVAHVRTAGIPSSTCASPARLCFGDATI